MAPLPSAEKNNRVHSKNLLVNYCSLLGGTILSKGLGLVTVLILTRALGVDDFGQYSLVFSFWALLNTLMDLGGSHIAGREIAKNPNRPRPVIESIIYLRLMGCLLFLPVGVLLGQGLGLSNLLILVTYAGLFTGFEAYYDIYFSASMQLDKTAKARFASSIVNVLLILAAVVFHANLFVIILIAMLNPLVKLALDYSMSRFQLSLHRPDWGSIQRIFKDGWPLWLGGLQYIVLARVDTLMLQMLSPTGHYDLGIYSAAFRVSEIMALFINALCPAMLPLLVQRAHDHAKINVLTRTGMRVILTILMSMSLLIFWYAPWITQMYGHGYAQAAGCIQILIWSQAFAAINALCYYLLLVYNAQGKRVIILANVALTAFNIGLNFVLIPLFKAEGAAWATVLTEVAILLTMLTCVRAFTPLRLGRDILLLEGLTLASLLIGINLGVWAGLCSTLVFIALVFGFKVLKPDQLRTLAAERMGEVPPTAP